MARRRAKDDGTTHLRIVFQSGRDSWPHYESKNGSRKHVYDESVSVCNKYVFTADTYASPTRNAAVTCGTCAVFGDAWLERGLKGRLTVRRVRALQRELTGRKPAMQTTESGWYMLLMDNALSHIVPAELVLAIQDDLESRVVPFVPLSVGPPTITSRVKLDRFGIDLGGMAVMGRPYEEFVVGGAPMSVPSEHVRRFRVELAALPARTAPNEAGTKYFKLKTGFNAVVLTSAQRSSLVSQMAEREVAAEKRADEFYSQRGDIDEGDQDL